MSSHVILADDEEMLRDGLIYLVDWEALDCEVVYRAANGQEVITWLETHDEPVDIVVSDIRMPVVDGLELAQYLYRNCRDTTEMILLTGYADFAYAQAAIRANVCDFVLKSAVTGTLPAAVRKAQQNLKRKQEQHRKLIDAQAMAQKGRRTQMENLLRGAAQDQPDASGAFNVDFQPPYLVASYEIASSAQLSVASARPSILNVLCMCLKNYASVSISVSPTQYCSLICLPEADSSLRELIKELHNIISVLNNYTQYSVRIGLSARREDPAQLSVAYRESVAALNQLFNDHNVIALYGKQRRPPGDKPAPTDPRMVTDQLSELMLGDRSEEMMELLKRYFDDFLHSGEAIETLKLTSVLVYTTLIVNVGTVDIMDEWDEQNDERFYQEIESARTVRNIYDILCGYLRKYLSLRQNAPGVKNYLVRQVNAYIYSHYAENINLQIIADTFHVSCGYLGRLYRRETGVSLVIALNNRRIEVAKRMLRDTSQKIFEIAHAVGIDDPTYFTHIFVKYTGESPSAYRNNA